MGWSKFKLNISPLHHAPYLATVTVKINTQNALLNFDSLQRPDMENPVVPQKNDGKSTGSRIGTDAVPLSTTLYWYSQKTADFVFFPVFGSPKTLLIR